MDYDFTKEEEVKQYLENIGTEYRFGCFSEKKPEVCHVLGQYLQLISNETEKSGYIFKLNCDDYNYPRSCEAYAKLVITSKLKDQEVRDKKYEIAFKYFLKACNLNVPNACYNAGVSSYNENLYKADNKKDYSECIRLMDKACCLKNDNACFFLSKLFILGTPDNVLKTDMKNGFNYSLKSCNLGNPKACFNVSKMYKKGEGIEKNIELSNYYKKRAKIIKDFLN